LGYSWLYGTFKDFDGTFTFDEKNPSADKVNVTINTNSVDTNHPQISRALQACNEPQQTRLRIAIECHSCIQWLTPALENFRASW
ncbi:YceI family protein, partial [Salmonella enterica subsp. enterica serovar Lubbock]|nr:YceI family protein [Salmonella enterica subsp. enterica serovar Lubbock]